MWYPSLGPGSGSCHWRPPEGKAFPWTVAPGLCWLASCWPPGLLLPPSLWVLWPEAPGLGWWGPRREPWQLLMHSSSEAKLLALPWQPPYQKRLHWPTEAMKYQRAAQSAQEPWALGSRHRTGYAEGRRMRQSPRQEWEHADTSAWAPDLAIGAACSLSRPALVWDHSSL